MCEFKCTYEKEKHWKGTKWMKLEETLGYKIIFVWYRNWWLNKNEEIQRIHKVLNE